MTNQEGQTPLDLATADDVRSLLIDAMPLGSAPTTAKGLTPTTPIKNSTLIPAPSSRRPGPGLASDDVDTAQGAVGGVGAAATPAVKQVVTSTSQTGDGAADSGSSESSTGNPLDISIGAFLRGVQLDHLREIFERELVS